MGFWGAVTGEVVEAVAKDGGEEGKGRAGVLWFVSTLCLFPPFVLCCFSYRRKDCGLEI